MWHPSGIFDRHDRDFLPTWHPSGILLNFQIIDMGVCLPGTV
jgi:hypothetical protein